MGILFYLVYYIISSTYINSATTSIKKNTNNNLIKSNTLIKKNTNNNLIKSNTLIKKKK